MKNPTIHLRREEHFDLALALVVTLIAVMSAAVGLLCSPPFAVALSAALAAWLGVHVQNDPRVAMRSRPHPAKRFALIGAVATPIGVIARALVWPDSVQKDDALWGLGLLLVICAAILASCYRELRSPPGHA